MSRALVCVAVLAYALTVAATFPIGALVDPERHREMSWRWRFGIAFFTWPGFALGLLLILSLLGLL